MAEHEYVVERYHDICAGHRVVGHENKCAHLHGHNYRITFYCASEPAEWFECGNAWHNFDRLDLPTCPECGSTDRKVKKSALDDVGRVIDFSVIKETLCEWLEQKWDHKMLLWVEDPIYNKIVEMGMAFEWGVRAVEFNPTAENMAHFLVQTLGPELLSGTGVRLVKVKVEETRKCSVTYTLPES